MKFCLVVLTIALVGAVTADDDWSVPKDKAAVYDMNEKCVKESGVTEEQIEKIKKNQRFDDKEVQAYVHCNVKAMGLFSDDAGYNVDRMGKFFTALHIDEEKSRDVIAKCVDSNEQKSTPVEWAFRGVECLMNNNIGDLFKEAVEKIKKNEVENKA